MYIFAFCIGVIVGLMIGVYLGAQIIDERNREIKYIRRELEKAATAEKGGKDYDLFV